MDNITMNPPTISISPFSSLNLLAPLLQAHVQAGPGTTYPPGRQYPSGAEPPRRPTSPSPVLTLPWHSGTAIDEIRTDYDPCLDLYVDPLGA
jgi:hypothetical protein